MRFNEFDTHNNLETKLKHFFEGKISSKDFSSYIKENQITEADLLENALSGLFKNAPKLGKLWDKFGKAFRKGANPKQGELPLKGGSNTRPSAPKPPAAAPKPPAAAPKIKPSTVGKVASGAALGAAGTAAVLGTGGDAGPDKAQAAPPKDGSGPKPDGEQTFGQAFAAARKAQGGPGGKFSYKGKEYQTNIKGEKYVKNPTSVGPNSTLELQKRLKAAGADIKADGLMGPNTRAAMKKYGIGQSTPAAPAPARPSTPVQSGGAGGEFGGGPARPSTPAQSGGGPETWASRLAASKKRDPNDKIMFRGKEYTRAEAEKRVRGLMAKRDAMQVDT